MSPDSTPLAISVVAGTAIGVYVLVKRPAWYLRFDSWATRWYPWFVALWVVALPFAAVDHFRSGDVVFAWMDVALASFALTFVGVVLSAKLRGSARRGSGPKTILRVCATFAALLFFGGTVLQELGVPPKRPIPASLAGKTHFTLGAGEFVVP